jgi:hypothetical protein
MIRTIQNAVFATEAEAVPRAEHPRPDFARAAWQNLNGSWDFRFDPDNEGETKAWFAPDAPGFDETITVPFPWQSELSGVAAVDYRGVAWYRRSFTVPPNWGEQRLFLRFGAVDYRARVWLDGEFVGEHEGGYSPFEFDITPLVGMGVHTLVVRVDDPANLDEIPHGKQRNQPPDPWDDVAFTPSSGIWQTVWIEPRPASYLLQAHVTPDIDRAEASFAVSVAAGASGTATLELRVEPPVGSPLTSTTELALTPANRLTTTVELAIPAPQLWDIDSPNLYTFTLRLRGPDGQIDSVRGYFGMRKIEARAGQIWLNNRPLYLMSALDQGYWPDGLYTAPSDAALRADIAYAKALGLNGLRKHIKVEDPRYAYWADQLGILLWCDVPNPTRFTLLAQARLQRELDTLIARDYNHPSIVIWSPYNESWGLEFRLDTNDTMQAWVSSLYDRSKALDPTRLVVDNSGWSHVKTDIADSHYYTNDPVEWRGTLNLLARAPDELVVLGHRFFADGYRYAGQPRIMSEYGAGWRDDRSWALRWQTTELRRHPEIVGYTYTELYDIEYEYAGYALYDRTPKTFGYEVAMLNSADFIGVDYRGPATLAPGATLTMTPFISAYDHTPFNSGTVRWQLLPTLPDLEAARPLLEGSFAATPTPYTVTTLPDLAFIVPDAQGPVQLRVVLYDEQGRLRAQNSLDFEIFDAPLPRSEVSADGRTIVLRTNPSAVANSSWSKVGHEAGARVDGHYEAVWGREYGYVEYHLDVPPQLDQTAVGMRVQLEAAARPAEVTMSHAGRRQPSDLTIALNGVELDTRTLPDLHANSLGALSMINGFGAGQHGEYIELAVPPDVVPEIAARARAQGKLVLRLEVKADAAHRGGLTLFGDRSGRYGIDPTITVAVMPPPSPAVQTLVGVLLALGVLGAVGFLAQKMRHKV